MLESLCSVDLSSSMAALQMQFMTKPKKDDDIKRKKSFSASCSKISRIPKLFFANEYLEAMGVYFVTVDADLTA